MSLLFNWRSLIVGLIWSFSWLYATAQNQDHGTGVILDEAAYAQVPRLEAFAGAKTKRSLPRYSLRQYCPIPGNQGSSNACVGWAAGYGAMTISQAIQDQNTNREAITQNAFSASFIFNQIKSKNCGGALLTDALDLLKKTGDCRYQTFGDNPYDCEKPPAPHTLSEAEKYKIKDYAALFYKDDAANLKIKKVLQAIAQDNPVIAVLQVSPSFYQIEIGQEIWSPDTLEAAPLMGHAMVVTGYDKRLRKLELMNSWGPNWGDQGFIWISFEDFAKLAWFGFQLLPDHWHSSLPTSAHPDSSTSTLQYMSGTLTLLTDTLSDYSQMAPTFTRKEATVFDLQNGFYQVISGEWHPYSGYKLGVNDLTKGIYLYLFSLNPQGEINFLYPLKKDLDTGFKLAHFIPGDSLEMSYPPGEDWLELEYPGVDYLGALFSWRAIPDVEDKIAALQHLQMPLPERLTNVFGDALIPLEEIDFDLENMTFRASISTDRKQQIVPLIFAIDVWDK